MQLGTLTPLKAFEAVSPVDWAFAAAAMLLTYAVLTGVLRLAVGRFGALSRRMKSQAAGMIVAYGGSTAMAMLVPAVKPYLPRAYRLMVCSPIVPSATVNSLP